MLTILVALVVAFAIGLGLLLLDPRDKWGRGL